jgi:hypothetical protein
MTSPVTPATLQTAFTEVTKANGLSKYVSKLRENHRERFNTKRKDLLNMFENMELWKRTDNADGHAAFEHTITHVRVGFQRHGNGSEIPAAQAMDVMEQLQIHINILGNEIFRYRTASWKTVPDFNESVKNYAQWVKQNSNRTSAA